MSTAVESVRLEYQAGTYVPVASPRVSWVTVSDVSGWRQYAAELEWNDAAGTTNVPIDGDGSVLVAWPFTPLAAHQRGTLRVRVQGPDGWSEWSDEQSVASGFLGEGEWQAEFIGLAAPARHAQPALLRTEFDVAEGLERATLYATAHGVYQALVNSHEVDDQILKPGWTVYQSRLVHETTDVTSLLVAGKNALGVTLAGGWYTEIFGFRENAGAFYGEQPAFAGQLLLEYEDGTSAWVVTGTDWSASGEGPWVASGIYLGERYDARKLPSGWSGTGFAADGWEPAAVLPAGPVPEPRTSPEVRVTQVVAVADVITSPSGATLLDFGQNLVGRLRITVTGAAGDTVTLRHAEVLENGELGVRTLRAAEATDTYTLAGTGVEEWSATQTFHGFRYAEVSGWPGDFDPADVVAEVVGSDMRRTGWFDCSDPMVSRLHENVVWGMRGNFLYLPTDCPQRDERLGWTGDIQVFSPTASYLFDCDGFLASWLVDLDLEQQAGGGVPFIVPDVLHSAKTPAAAWGDVATILPWNLYERFGDVGVLTAQYYSAKAWVDQLLDIAGDRFLWEGGFQFGDWVDPDAPPDQPAKAKADPDLVASAYLFRSAETFSRHALVLGHTEDAAHYAAVAEKVRQAWLAEYVTPAGRILSDAQTSYALAIAFGIATGEVLATMGKRLAWLVRRDGYRIGTGFVGTPIIADALSSTGHTRQAGRMLQQTECPSWLYPITMGATTIWERWDSMLEDGSINPGEMTSFNHYALGAIADWLHRIVAGLAPAEAGYRKLEIAPQFLPGLDWASTRHETPYGTASVAWRRTGDQVVVEASVPANTSAVVRFPGSEPFIVAAGTFEWTVTDAQATTATGPITTSTPLATIIDDTGAYATVMGAFRTVSPDLAKEFSKRTAWLPNEPLIGGFTLITPAVAAEIESNLAVLNQSRGH
jgi:alpha-L-rhamnosidase